MTRKLNGVKPQDILILLKILATEPRPLSQADLAGAVRLSLGEVSYGLQRLREARLLDYDGKLLRTNVLELLLHAVKYIVPGQLGKISRGVPTSHSAPILAKRISSSDTDSYVLEHPAGQVRGQSVTPIYKTAADAALADEGVYAMIALLDAIRVGKAREQKMAREMLSKIIKGEEV